jgi:hypothetical protein
MTSTDDLRGLRDGIIDIYGKLFLIRARPTIIQVESVVRPPYLKS